jgi:hypothetical protein
MLTGIRLDTTLEAGALWGFIYGVGDDHMLTGIRLDTTLDAGVLWE